MEVEVLTNGMEDGEDIDLFFADCRATYGPSNNLEPDCLSRYLKILAAL